MKALIKYIIIIFAAATFFGCAGPQSSSGSDDDVMTSMDDSEEGLTDEDEADADGAQDTTDSQETAQNEETQDPAEDEIEALDEEKPQEPVAEEQLQTEEEPAMPLEEAPADDIAQEFQDSVADAPSDPIEITNIRFVANKSNVVIETTGTPKYTTRANPETNQFVIEIENATLPQKLTRPFIMKEFDGSDFAAVNAYQNAGGSTARIVVQLKQASEPAVALQGTSLIVAPNAAALASAGVVDAEVSTVAATSVKAESVKEESDEFAGWDQQNIVTDNTKLLGARSLSEFLTGNNRFYGKKISIQVKDADIREVINFISEESGVNLVISEDVKGTISMKLRNVPWDQALVVVLRARKLGYIRQGNVLRISTLEALQKDTEAAKAVIDAQKALDPVRVKVFPISYSKVEDLTKQVEPFLTASRGKAVADPRTSSLILTDTDEVIRKMERLIAELDVPPAQVMIEGKVVEASEEFKRTLGINWGFSGNPTEISATGGANGSPVNLNTRVGVRPLASDVVAGSVGSFNLNVATLDFLGNVDAAFALAESNSIAKVISSPRVVTLNKEKAEISQKGEVISITSTIPDGGGDPVPNVQRTPVELRLEVTPQITAAGSVLMDVLVKREFAGPQLEAKTLARSVNSRNAKTKVLVSNGQTAVIGGIYQSDALDSETGVPGLKNIPVLGWLFKSRVKEKFKNELLIFVTPRILNLADQAAKVEGEKPSEETDGETDEF